MTMSCFTFDLSDMIILFYLQRNSQETFRTAVWKMLNILASLVYVLYDALKETYPGPGSMAVLSLASLCEVFLLALEALLVIKRFYNGSNAVHPFLGS